VVVAALSILSGCAGSLEDPQRFDAGTANGFVCPTLNIPVKAEILAKKCAAGCHSAAVQMSGLDLESPGSAGRLVDVSTVDCPPRKRVATVDGGTLQEMISQSSPTCGTAMPPGSPLTNSEIACVVEWTRYLVAGGTE
jgi:hypothetical protein